MFDFYIQHLLFALDWRCLKMFWRLHKTFGSDKRYSVFRFLNTIRHVLKDEKIVKYKGRYYLNSFFPPVPSQAFMQMINAVPEGDSIFENTCKAKRTAPISMYVAVTGKCMYNCKHCSNSFRKDNEELSTNDLTNLVEQLLDMGVSIIGFTGGEPLLRDDLCEIISKVDDRAESVVFTSGYSLSSEYAQSLANAGLNTIGISLDHFNEQTFDNMRGRVGAFQNSLTAIKNAANAGIYTMVQTVVKPKDFSDNHLWKLAELISTTKAHEIRVLETIPAGNLLKCSKGSFFTMDERNKLIDFQRKANRIKGFPKITVFAHTESHDLFGCGAGTQHSYIDCNGNLCPCDFVPLSFGNVKTASIDQLWKEMNLQIGKPCSICMAFELQSQLNKISENKLPLNTEESLKTLENREPILKFPGFYQKLTGEL